MKKNGPTVSDIMLIHNKLHHASTQNHRFYDIKFYTFMT